MCPSWTQKKPLPSGVPEEAASFLWKPVAFSIRLCYAVFISSRAVLGSTVAVFQRIRSPAGIPGLFCLKVSTQPQNIDSCIDRHKILWYKDRMIDCCAHSAEMRGAGRSWTVRGYALHTLLSLYACGVGDTVSLAPLDTNLTPASDKCYNKCKIKGVWIKLRR